MMENSSTVNGKISVVNGNLEKEQEANASTLRRRSFQKKDEEVKVDLNADPGKSESSPLSYGLRENPPIAVTIMAAVQHILLSVSACLTTSTVVADVACAPFDHHVRTALFCSTIFMVGLCTIMQTALGVRLPVFQGASSTFLVPLLALQSDPVWKCKASPSIGGTGMSNVTMASNTSTIEEDTLAGIEWRLQEMSGALMVASLFEVVIGGSGLLNLLLRFIGPIPIACTISLVGVSLYRLPIIYGRANFPLALACLALIMISILFLGNVGIPLPKIGKNSQKKPRKFFYVFRLMPLIFAVVITWAIIGILTACNVFTDNPDDIGYQARADAKFNIIKDSDWFRFTYPGQFGAPRFNVAIALGFLVACLSSAVESVGDYYATQKACETCVPPPHAISRGILIEGIGSIISGAVGAGHATTSFSGNIALLTLTKTGSRIVMYVAGGILLVLSVIGKAGAAICTIPDPILGGVMMTTVATLLVIGLSNLKHVDLTSPRNMLVVGVPFMAGIVVPACLEMYPDLIDTGSEEADRVIGVIIGTPMFLGGVLAVILDVAAPGSPESRGMTFWDNAHSGGQVTGSTSDVDETYGWTIYPRIARCCPWITYLPFMPKLSSKDEDQYKNHANEMTSF